MRISKHIVSFDGDYYFEFLQDELKSLGNNIHENLRKKLSITGKLLCLDWLMFC